MHFVDNCSDMQTKNFSNFIYSNDIEKLYNGLGINISICVTYKYLSLNKVYVNLFWQKNLVKICIRSTDVSQQR